MPGPPSSSTPCAISRAGRADVPVFLVAKSGGSGVIVKALEQLEEGSVERAILLAPALSPDYDLSAALRALVRDMVVFWSPLGRLPPRRGDSRLRHGRPGQDGERGDGRLPCAVSGRGVPGPFRVRRPVRQAASGPMDRADGGDRLPGRSLRTGFSGFSQELCCSPAADGAGRPVLNCGGGSSQSGPGPISIGPEARIGASKVQAGNFLLWVDKITCPANDGNQSCPTKTPRIRIAALFGPRSGLLGCVEGTVLRRDAVPGTVRLRPRELAPLKPHRVAVSAFSLGRHPNPSCQTHRRGGAARI